MCREERNILISVALMASMVRLLISLDNYLGKESPETHLKQIEPTLYSFRA